MQRSAVSAYSVEEWTNFALAQTGVAAVLIGLVFVALSINLRDIVASASLLDRAVESVVLFGIVLVSSSLVLAPNHALGVACRSCCPRRRVRLHAALALTQQPPTLL